jgi:hypothetical protein
MSGRAGSPATVVAGRHADCLEADKHGKDVLTPSAPGRKARSHFGRKLDANIDGRRHRGRKVVITNAAVAVASTEMAP